MIIDTHAHLWRESISDSKAKILALCAEYDVKKVFISTLSDVNMLPDDEEIDASNRETYRFMKEQPDLVEGMVYINPRSRHCLDVCKRGIEQEGMRGIKAWVAVPVNDPLLDPVCEYAIQARVPLLVHTFYKATGLLPFESRAWQACELARRYPELKLIIAHIGYNVYDTARCLYDCPNAYVDISGSSTRKDDIDYIVRHIGAERVLFGTDMPGSFENCLGQVLGASLTPEQRQAVLYQNAHDLFYGEAKAL